MSTLIREDIREGLRELGLKQGDVVLVHSAMRTLGRVVGGAEAAVRHFWTLSAHYANRRSCLLVRVGYREYRGRDGG